MRGSRHPLARRSREKGTRPMGPTYQTDLRSLSIADLDKATIRAWREAARCWGEFRREPKDSPIKAMLLTSAEAAEEWWQTLRDEQADRLSRDESPVEVRS